MKETTSSAPVPPSSSSCCLCSLKKRIAPISESLTLDSHVFDSKIVLYFFLFFFFSLCLRKERGAATQSSQYFKSVARANLRREKGKKRKKVLRFSGVTQYLLTIISLSIPHALYILHARKRRFITDARNIKSANQMEACESFETP